MNIADIYGGDWLKLQHLNGQDVPVVIAAVGVESFESEGRTKQQVVLSFAGHTKRLGLCKTNALTIAAMLGDDTDAWVGQSITLWPDPTVTMKGAVVGGVRVRPVPPTTPPAVPPTVPTPASLLQPIPVPNTMPAPAPNAPAGPQPNQPVQF